MQMPMQPREHDYHRYHVQNHQFPVPDMQRPFVNIRAMNPMEQGMIPPIVRNIAQMMGGARMAPPMSQRPIEIPIDVRQIPIEMIRGMRPPMDQEPHQMYPQEQPSPAYNQDQSQGMMPPPPPPPAPTIQEAPQNDARIPQVIIHQQVEQRPTQLQDSAEKGQFPFPGLPLEIRRIIQQVPMEIKNIIQHITGEIRPVQVVPEGARREV